MKLTVTCLFSIILCFAAGFSSAQWNSRNYNYRLGRNTNLNYNGLNHRSNNGRHNTNLNYRQLNYNYGGNRWNTNVNHNFRSRQTNLNANYRRNHNFQVGHNWQNRQTNLGYTWKFGKRRRSIDLQDELLESLKIEREPSVFLKNLQLAIKTLVKRYQYECPYIENLAISVPNDHVTNVTAARETICVVMKLQSFFPNSLGHFILKMIEYHNRSFEVEDFFSVDSEDETESESAYVCELPAESSESPVCREVIDGARLLDLKKFTTTLITLAMEYQQLLEA
ncbi:uncharacterized protein DDB_G0280315-like [Dendronephthya gigantea]|uniref:uncharacterized protein DDB_G0280315-like n=1 Tax=Dendronephthya gigantea TaxID=151771 RepID=UPI00106CAD89|nr:uncharacterized protein DDB_G0280315-like [Dendronephthya gigantea]